jgi:iron complex transport system ATP-binding protein
MSDALQATDVSVHRGPREVVTDVSLTAHYGALLAIVGPNGAGKTTLLKALAGLLPRTGSVRVAGAALDGLSAAERARSLAYVPQRSLMADGVSVCDVVAQARYAHRGAFPGFGRGVDPVVQQALARTQLEPLARRAFDTLSGGEQRRVLTARALATQARVLLLDEPSAGLDVAHALRLFQLLAELRAEGYALICVLHDLDEVRRYADSTLLLHHGRCLAQGPSAELLRAERLREVYGVFAHENVGLGFSLDGRWP